jgi:uncharacterized repeat protein (TIGR03803 family)
MKRSNPHRQLLMLASLALAFAATLNAQTYTDLFDFDGTSHGCCPLYPANLAQGHDGNLYGTTYSGGTSTFGTVFKITPSGTLTVLHNFNFSDGASPQGGLSLGLDGNFYGATVQGGAHSAGTVFTITPSGTFTSLYRFTNGSDGAFPFTPPRPAADGNFYGLTGNSTNHVFYKITKAGVFTALATMPAQSYGALLLGTDGKFYGTTIYGGTFNAGTAFSITTAGVLKTLWNFTSATGTNPLAGLIQGTDGNFYGAASGGGTLGGGVVFKLTSGGAYTDLFNFDSTSSANGKFPDGALVQGSDGFLYGATSGGGSGSAGVLFKIKTNGTSFSVLHNFDTTHGGSPESALFLHTNGKIYGMTQNGGAHSQGVFYSLDNSLKAFASPVVISSGKVGASVGVLGQGFNTATGVLFGTGAGTFTITNDTFLTAKVATGDTTGVITVEEPGGNLLSPLKFKVVPAITSFAPPSGPVGTSVVIKGTSLQQTSAVKFGGKAATVFTVNSDTQVTATVPTGAVTGKITITTPGGTATSSTNFTVN